MGASIHDIIYNLPAEPKLICLSDVFGDDRPVELEIGCGKGGFLLEESRLHEDRNYLGVEWAAQYFRFAADRMARWGRPNVRILRADARQFVLHYLAPASIAALHVYHPDPWPKRRHHKRRLFDEAFVGAVVRVLADGGPCHVQTDHADYFRVIAELLTARPEFEQMLCTTHEVGRAPVVATNYQIKYQQEGRAIHALRCVRKPRSL